MQQFVNLVWSGIWLGGAYGIVAIALVACYRSARIINVSVGALFVLAGMLMQWLIGKGWAVVPAALAAIVIGPVVLAAQERVILRRMTGAEPAMLLLGTLSVALALSGVTAVWFGRDPVTGPGLGQGVGIVIGIWHTKLDALIVAGAACGLALVGWLALERSATGRAITAVGADPGAAQMVAINVWRLRMIATVFAGLAAAIGGVVFVPVGILDFSQGLSFLLYGFVAASIAGYMSVGWTLLAAVGFGIVSALGTAYVSSVFAQAVAFGILAAVVLVSQSVPGLRRGVA